MTKPTRAPAVPPGTGPSGRKLWTSLMAEFTFDEHELALLKEAVRTTDTLDRLAEVVAKDGLMLGDRLHPAVVEQRQLRITLARLLVSLRLPDGEEAEGGTQGRRQRRGTTRGVYRRSR